MGARPMIPSWLLYFIFAELLVLVSVVLHDTWKWRIAHLVFLTILVLFFTAPMVPGLVRFGSI